MMKMLRMKKRPKVRKMRRKKISPKVKKTSMKKGKARVKVTMMVGWIDRSFEVLGTELVYCNLDDGEGEEDDDDA